MFRCDVLLGDSLMCKTRYYNSNGSLAAVSPLSMSPFPLFSGPEYSLSASNSSTVRTVEHKPSVVE